MENKQRVKNKVFGSILLLSVGFTYPLTAYAFGAYIGVKNQLTYFQASALLVAAMAYISHHLYQSAFSILNPDSDFGPKGLYELRQKYVVIVNRIGKASVWLGFYSLIFGGLVTIFIS
ncbi:hypothetical protein [Vibrio alginolyticus]|uniref:hypothetical protein n=1 Tax=Vibrio alginolyticus TaxID=663 RepID=UPI000CE9A5BD|nr:hypothetical protein [Vibrio alginolyticus]AVF66034.1 hypothetical protein AL541_17580 [Vibrio alginolyticus]